MKRSHSVKSIKSPDSVATPSAHLILHSSSAPQPVLDTHATSASPKYAATTNRNIPAFLNKLFR